MLLSKRITMATERDLPYTATASPSLLVLSDKLQGKMMKGSCLCGGIEYDVRELNSPIQHCSCKTCRKAHAAAFNTVAGVQQEDFRWLKGQLLLSKFESSLGVVRYFCSRCGTQLVKEKEGSSILVLRVATLDEDPGKAPEFRIWASHEVPWLNYTSEIPVYKEWEPGR